MVTLSNSNQQKIGDVVRGGNVLGEEEAKDADPEQVHTETLLGGAQVGEQDWDLITHSLASLF